MVGHPDVSVLRFPRPAPPRPGTFLAGHRVEATIGRGGMGVVYRARDCRLGRVVALKVIAPEHLEDATVQRRFLEEAVTAASFEHPNVVPVYDAGESDGIAYMVMRYVPGMDLCAMACALGPLGPARAAGIVAAVGGALDAMHGAGYVHRDVKPRNVLIARDGHVYLTDFGLARRVASGAGATCAGHWVGTVDYAAPEQIRGGHTDARTDVYGLGCLLHFCLTGHAPYARENLEARLWAHLHEPPPSPSQLREGVPTAMDALVARALAKDPADRFASAGELGRSALLAVAGTAGTERVEAPEMRARRLRVADAGFAEAATVSRAQPAPTELTRGEAAHLTAASSP